MALARCRILIDAPTGIPADRVIWTFGVSSTDGLIPAGLLADAVTEAFDFELDVNLRLGNYLASGYDPVAVEVYAANGGPVQGVSPLTVPQFSGDPHLPYEVALCCSWATDTPRGERPTGRVYIGPWASVALGTGANAGRPTQTAINLVGSWGKALGEAIAAVGVANDHTLVVITGPSGVLADVVVGAWVDNAWDTQRRRGVERTSVTTFDITP